MAASCPPDPTPRLSAPTRWASDKRYVDLIAQGKKTTEIRVNDSSRKKIRKGALIRFRCQGDEVLDPRHQGQPVRQLRGDIRPRVRGLGQPAGYPRRAAREHPPDLPARAPKRRTPRVQVVRRSLHLSRHAGVRRSCAGADGFRLPRRDLRGGVDRSHRASARAGLVCGA
ncbi:ASCH domain-containing protein [Saccharopolyspora thermophila]|uniref:ASCH domain-containing protein n=1 Tax=Saccharopolyspora thermophila TaxID=89367 RepID=UPI003D153D1D